MLFNDILLVVLGWLLGLLAPAIVDKIKNEREIKGIKIALLAELEELKYRLVLIAFKIESKYGNLNKDFFQWTQDILVKYKGVNSSETLIATIGPLLKMTPEEMETFSVASKERSKNNLGLELKKIPLSFLDSSLSQLSRFDQIYSGQLLEIKTRIGFMNEIVDDSRYYFRLSFQNNISPANYEIANNNMISSYKNYGSQARNVIDFIDKVLSIKS